MRILVLLAALLATSTTAAAQTSNFRPLYPEQPSSSYSPPAAPQTRHSYDWQSGNSYTTTTQPDGSATVRGFNYNTGSMWNSRMQPNGNQSGMDSRGNLWNYNARTGSYLNSDGTVCIGKGAARTCN